MTVKRKTTEELTPKEKHEVLENIREGLLEARLARQGKVKLQTWEEFAQELRG